SLRPSRVCTRSLHDALPICTRAESGGVMVAVKDSGVGMNEEERKRCLEPFFTTKGERGTGLGLSVVYGIIQRHEGRIEIESAPGDRKSTRLNSSHVKNSYAV